MIEPQEDMGTVDPLLCIAELNLELAAKRLSVGRPKRCECNPLTAADLAQRYTMEPTPALRAELLTMPIRTRADAMAVLRVIEAGSDMGLTRHLVACLHSYLTAA
jgi:hypothetical protein